VASGDFSRVLQEAGREGVDRVLASHSLTDLVAMGDAARYGRDAPLARRTYETVRSRFPASGEARTAAFLLGRAAEEHDHSNADALRWYDAYLTEAPAGPFAGDALGRKMVIVSKTQGREAAKAIAARYLGQFPDGPYAAPARDLAP
jgi:TolA-binding protein